MSTKPLILAVDDIDTNIDILLGILGDQYEISVAMDGETALEIALEDQPDIILLDIMMPDMNGYEVCQRLKEHPLTKEIPVIFLTAKNEIVDETKGFAVGAVDYIIKPISPPVLTARIHTHLKLKQASDALTQKNQMLNDAIAKMNLMQNTLIQIEKMASLGRLVAGFAHELNTPIGIAITLMSGIPEIVNHLQQMFAQEEIDEDELHATMKRLVQSANLGLANLQKAADLMTRFKRTSADQASEASRNINVKDVLQDVITSVHSVFMKTRINIELLCPNDIMIHSKPGLIGQLMTNLLMNSHRHGFNSGTLEGKIIIDTQHDPQAQKLHIRYTDNGQGIAPENLNIIFEPFFTTARNSGGSGLGLMICYNIIKMQLHGEISCHSEFGKGVVFDISFPTDHLKI